eukprot:m.71257 g.71257  ORF g.71257 m.71257 type:complete len:113 (-) comp12291_c0_seq1:250-588(-)
MGVRVLCCVNALLFVCFSASILPRFCFVPVVCFVVVWDGTFLLPFQWWSTCDVVLVVQEVQAQFIEYARSKFKEGAKLPRTQVFRIEQLLRQGEKQRRLLADPRTKSISSQS